VLQQVECAECHLIVVLIRVVQQVEVGHTISSADHASASISIDPWRSLQTAAPCRFCPRDSCYFCSFGRFRVFTDYVIRAANYPETAISGHLSCNADWIEQLNEAQRAVVKGKTRIRHQCAPVDRLERSGRNGSACTVEGDRRAPLRLSKKLASVLREFRGSEPEHWINLCSQAERIERRALERDLIALLSPDKDTRLKAKVTADRLRALLRRIRKRKAGP
jgi:hypothetical protein